MNYSDKVQATINSAHDTAIANKILDMMQDLLLKNDENTARRWIWELIQNASFMEEHGEITPKEAEKITGKSAATVRRYFKILVDTRYIMAEGSTNNIVYRISMNMPEDV